MNDDITGSWSAGTDKTEDLLDVHVQAAKALLDWHKDRNISDHDDMEKAEREIEAVELRRISQGYDNESSELDIEQLKSVLSDLSPPGFHWGEHQTEPLNFGFWKTAR